MRATEINIVFEDEDGKTVVSRFSGRGVVALSSSLIGTINGWREAGHDPNDILDSVCTRVLRKVTEIEGRYTPDCECDYIHPVPASLDRRSAIMSDIVPPEPQEYVGEGHTEHDGCSSSWKYTGVYRYRFTCEAVRVPDPERDAQEIGGLPEKKGETP